MKFVPLRTRDELLGYEPPEQPLDPRVAAIIYGGGKSDAPIPEPETRTEYIARLRRDVRTMPTGIRERVFPKYTLPLPHPQPAKGKPWVEARQSVVGRARFHAFEHGPQVSYLASRYAWGHQDFEDGLSAGTLALLEASRGLKRVEGKYIPDPKPLDIQHRNASALLAWRVRWAIERQLRPQAQLGETVEADLAQNHDSEQETTLDELGGLAEAWVMSIGGVPAQERPSTCRTCGGELEYSLEAHLFCPKCTPWLRSERLPIVSKDPVSPEECWDHPGHTENGVCQSCGRKFGHPRPDRKQPGQLVTMGDDERPVLYEDNPREREDREYNPDSDVTRDDLIDDTRHHLALMGAPEWLMEEAEQAGGRILPVAFALKRFPSAFCHIRRLARNQRRTKQYLERQWELVRQGAYHHVRRRKAFRQARYAREKAMKQRISFFWSIVSELQEWAEALDESRAISNDGVYTHPADLGRDIREYLAGIPDKFERHFTGAVLEGLSKEAAPAYAYGKVYPVKSDAWFAVSKVLPQGLKKFETGTIIRWRDAKNLWNAINFVSEDGAARLVEAVRSLNPLPRDAAIFATRLYEIRVANTPGAARELR